MKSHSFMQPTYPKTRVMVSFIQPPATGAKILIPISPEIKDVLERARAVGKVKGTTVIHNLAGGQYTKDGIEPHGNVPASVQESKTPISTIYERRRSAMRSAAASISPSSRMPPGTAP